LRRSMMHSVGYESGLGSDHASISESISSTLRGSYATRSRLERLNAEKARLHGAVANFLPTVNLTVEAAKSKRDSIIAGPFDQDQVDANVEVTVPIFTSGVNTNTLRQARHVSMAASYSYLAEEQVAALEAVAAHVNLRLNRKIVRSLKKNVVALDKLKVVAERLFAAGDASRTDIAIAQANVERARSEVNVARRTLDETRADYESLTGRKAPNKLSLSKPESLVPGDLESAIETALRNNPNLLAAEHSALASKHNAKIVRGQFGPQVNGFGNFQANLHNTVDPDPDNTWSVGVRMTVQYRALEQGRVLRRQITRQWAAYQSAARRVGILQRQVNAVRTSVDGTRREYEAGFRSISDVLNDQVRLTSAQISLETTRHEKILAAYEIAFATSHEGVQHLALAD